MTRFTDRVSRDLHQIADRATPSSTAWDSIRTRIEEQADQPTMEVIMLSPDRNDPPKRGWMLAAAAGTVILIGGLVFAVTRSDDDTAPADTPPPTLPAEPNPEIDAADPETADPDTAVAPELETDTPSEPGTDTPSEPEPRTGPVTVSVTGSFTDAQPLLTPGPGPVQALVGERTFAGEFDGVAPFTGRYWTTAEGSQRGDAEFEFRGDVEGLGSGTLTFTDAWQIADGAWSSTATITGGTGDFAGASGTAVFESVPATLAGGGGGTYTWDITVPPADSLVTVTVTGTAIDPDFTAEPTGVDGELSYRAGTVLEGDMNGLAPHTGTAWVLDDTTTVGTGDFEFTGDIDGLGSGTMTYTDVWVFDNGTTTYTVHITGGTGDFEGITGTGTFLDEGDVDPYEFVLTAPIGQ
jgi:hypothetical protein